MKKVLVLGLLLLLLVVPTLRAATINDGILRLTPLNFDDRYRKITVLINASEVNKTTGTSYLGVLLDSIIDSLNTTVYTLNSTQFHIRTNQELTFNDENTTGILFNGTTNRLQADSPFQVGNNTASLIIKNSGFDKTLGSVYIFGGGDNTNFTQIFLGHANTTAGIIDVGGVGAAGELFIQALAPQGATKFGVIGIFPDTDNTSTIGNSSMRWNQAFLHNLNMTGDLSIHGKITTWSPLLIQTEERTRAIFNSSTILFTTAPIINNSLAAMHFSVSCDVENTGLLGTAIPDVCYNFISFPLSYQNNVTTVTLVSGLATGGASALVVADRENTGFLAQWSCSNTVGQCGFLNATYAVTP